MADLLRISSLSEERLKVPVAVVKDGTAYNPTADDVSMAFAPIGSDPEDGDFVTGSWETVGTVFYARVLIAAGSLEKGRYTIWLKIVDDPETPVLEAGTLEVI